MMGVTRTEVRHFLLAILLVAFLFGFDDGQPRFELGHWLGNLFRMAVLAALVILVHDVAHRLVAKRFGSTTEFRIWAIRHYGFSAQAHFPIKIHFLGLKVIPIQTFPLGSVLGIFVAFLSRGALYVPLVESITIHTKEYTRLGKQRLKLKEWEDAVIALAGPLASILLVYLVQAMNSDGTFDQLILMSSLYALFHMIPVSSLDGGRIFLASPSMWVLGVVFLLLSVFFITVLNLLPSLVLLALVALLIASIFFYSIVYLEKL